MKKIILAVLVSVLLLSTMFGARLMVPAVASTTHPAASIWIEPSLIDVGYGYTFTIDVMVNVTAASCTPSASGLYGWDYHLKWNSTVLELTSYTIHFPPEWGASDWLPKDEIGHNPDCTNYHWLAVSALGIPPPLNETTTTMPIVACTYNFRVIYQPDYNGTLDLQDTSLADDTGTLIPHTVYDGEYRILSRRSPDVNLDGVVDMFDLVIVGIAFGSRLGDPNWNPLADLYVDALIDIFDMVIIGINYGKTG
ncbi:MAG: hypothetical protein ACE5J6_04475 [Candidatus Bathyarchaeia archaeon]